MKKINLYYNNKQNEFGVYNGFIRYVVHHIDFGNSNGKKIINGLVYSFDGDFYQEEEENYNELSIEEIKFMGKYKKVIKPFVMKEVNKKGTYINFSEQELTEIFKNINNK